MIVNPTFLLIKDHAGNEVKVKALKMADRMEFLSLRQKASDLLINNIVTQQAMAISSTQALQFALDSKADEMLEFQEIVKAMLGLHGLDYYQLDLVQIQHLLFDCSGKDGLLLQLEFVPLDKDAQILQSNYDARTLAIAQRALATGDWYSAQKSIDQLTYGEVTALVQAFNELHDRRTKNIKNPKANSNVTMDADEAARIAKDAFSKPEPIRAKNPQDALRKALQQN